MREQLLHIFNDYLGVAGLGLCVTFLIAMVAYWNAVIGLKTNTADERAKIKREVGEGLFKYQIRWIIFVLILLVGSVVYALVFK